MALAVEPRAMSTFTAALRQIEALLNRNQAAAALKAAAALVQDYPERHEPQVLLGHAHRLAGNHAAALQAARRAGQLAPGHPSALMLEADLLQLCGERAACIESLSGLVTEHSASSPRLLQDIAQRFTALGLHRQAEACHAAATILAPNQPAYLYNHASSLIALGRLEQAETVLDQVIAAKPDDADAWYNRATLRKQSVDRNHIAAIEAQLQASAPAAPARVALGYALAKEREDLGHHAAAFQALSEAANLRRRQLSYRVEDDVDTMQRIAAAFGADYFQQARAGHQDPRPLFVVGLPRSGTTLVDRILSSHSQVESRGESTDFALALMHCAGPCGSKAELIARSRQIDPELLGQRYCAGLSGPSEQRLIDKTPINFLYLGLIAKALPQARIIHLRRNPMDACYAMYKTLFRMAYPFSYSQQDLAQYWLAYDRLMQHWRAVLPAGHWLEIDYETLVSDQEGVSRQLVEFCDLPWEPACLNFESNRSPSLTASAAQVRQPIYRSSVALWRRYAEQLGPLRAALEQAGVQIDQAAGASS